MAAKVAQLVTTKSEADIAADLKARAVEAMKPVADLMREANAAGLRLTWDTIQPNGFGQY